MLLSLLVVFIFNYTSVSYPECINSVGEQMFDKLRLIITESVASGSHWVPLEQGKLKRGFSTIEKNVLKRVSVYLMTSSIFLIKLENISYKKLFVP